LSDEHPRHRPQTGLNEAGEAGEAGSTKDGNGSDPVVPDGVDGSAAELDEATKAAMELLKRGGKPHAA
jgi:hypothetical protein